VEELDEHSCIANVGSDSPRMLALWVGMIDMEFEVQDGTELADHSARWPSAT
jgi:hypothetical protein